MPKILQYIRSLQIYHRCMINDEIFASYLENSFIRNELELDLNLSAKLPSLRTMIDVPWITKYMNFIELNAMLGRVLQSNINSFDDIYNLHLMSHWATITGYDTKINLNFFFSLIAFVTEYIHNKVSIFMSSSLLPLPLPLPRKINFVILSETIHNGISSIIILCKFLFARIWIWCRRYAYDKPLQNVAHAFGTFGMSSCGMIELCAS